MIFVGEVIYFRILDGCICLISCVYILDVVKLVVFYVYWCLVRVYC